MWRRPTTYADELGPYASATPTLGGYQLSLPLVPNYQSPKIKKTVGRGFFCNRLVGGTKIRRFLKKGTLMPKKIQKRSGKKLSEDIHLFLKDNDYASAVSVLRSGMGATQVVRKNKDNGEKGVSYEEVPDLGTRMTAARLTLEYGFGKPATRHDITVDDKTQKTATPSEIMARLRDSGQSLASILNVYTDSLESVSESQPLELIEPEKD